MDISTNPKIQRNKVEIQNTGKNACKKRKKKKKKMNTQKWIHINY